jgi:Flp pilus assembly protein TadG
MTASHIDPGWTRNERGAVLIQVAVALLALLALSSFVFDYGVMWVSRGQAQNSADAGALSGAISLAFDSSTDQDAARAKAIALARRNRVWTEEPDITNADVTFPPCPP